MATERVQRHIDRLLTEAEDAVADSDWELVRGRARQVLALDPENQDAAAYLAAAERAYAAAGPQPALGAASSVPPSLEALAQPTFFCGGRYEVEKFLGEGGKKRVYLAHDTKLDRDVAFALIKTDGLNAEGEARIRREAQAMGKLGDHPQIVPVYDIGEEADQPYLVTQLMGGGDVEALIEEAPDHRVPLQAMLRIGDQVCQALEYAHSKGIVHRDLKPGNVWLTADGTAKLGDFGLAVALDRSRLTQAGMMVGTMSYMPPEQAMGGEVTPRSDLYSLGAMLYEMVCGRPPFVGDESVAIISQHLNAPPVSPSWHRPDLPPALETLILRPLEKDAGKRPASAAEVREALASITSGVTPAAAPGPTDVPQVHDPLYGRTFVGREQELRQLQAAFDVALSGQGSLAMVVGEPGIGKTSVCEQLATYVAVRGGRALVGHCYEEGSLSLPYLPFVEAMRSYVLTREPDDLRKDLGSGAAEVARLVSEIRDRLHVELRPAGDPEDDRWRLLQAVSGFLRNASTVQPLLVILEDLHDADRGTIDLLLHLSRNLQGTRLLMVGTYRDVEVDRSHPLSGALAELRRSGSFLRVPLRGLTVDEVQRMMSIVRGQDVPWSRAEAIHRQTEGNPLFVQEVLRYLVEEGIVVREGGRYLLTDAEAGIPEGLRDVVGKRLSRPSEKTNQVLSVAAVIGREFRLDALQRVASLPEEELYGALEEATERAVVEQRQALGVVAFRFTHAFFRQTLYEEIFIPRRIRLHQQVGKALEEVYGRRLAEHAAELAEHFVQSTEPGDLEKALRYCELAAQRAIQVFAYGEAVRHLEQALRTQEILDPDDKSRRCGLLLSQAEAMLPLEDPAKLASTVAEEAFAIADSLEDHGRAAQVAIMALEALLRAHGGAPSFFRDQFAEWAHRADHHAQAGTPERIHADLYLGSAEMQAAGPAAGHVYLRRAADHALDRGEDALVFAAAGWGLARLNALRDRPLLECLAREVRDRPREGIGARGLGMCLDSAGSVLLDCGDRTGAEMLWRELAQLADRTRDTSLTVHAMDPPAQLAFLDGRVEEAIARWESLHAQAQELGVSPGSLLAPVRQRFAVGRGDPDALTAWEQVVNNRPAQAGRAVILAYLGRHEEAHSIRERFGDVGSDEDESSWSILLNLLEVAILGGDLATVRALARRVAPLADRLHVVGTFALGGSVGRLLGEASALLGKPDEARAYYGQALEVCAKVRFRPEIALIRLHLAELLLNEADSLQQSAVSRPSRRRRGGGPKADGPTAEGLRAEALDHLDFAIAEFREMKMQPALERALGHKGLLKA